MRQIRDPTKKEFFQQVRKFTKENLSQPLNLPILLLNKLTLNKKELTELPTSDMLLVSLGSL